MISQPSGGSEGAKGLDATAFFSIPQEHIAWIHRLLFSRQNSLPRMEKIPLL